MSYEGLKAMIESLINTYKCPECSSKVIDKWCRYSLSQHEIPWILI